MTKRPKGVAQKHDRLPSDDRLMPIPTGLLSGPRSSGHAAGRMSTRDIPPGLQMVECFKPFLRHLLTLDLSRPTCADTATTCGFWAARSSANCRWTATSETAHRAGRWRSHRRRGWPAALPRRARGRAARLRRDMPKVFALPGRCREQPRPRAKPSTYDEPSEPLTAPMQTARPRGSRSSPAAAQRCAARRRA